MSSKRFVKRRSGAYSIFERMVILVVISFIGIAVFFSISSSSFFSM